jgi:hypothetical protein
MLKDKTLKSGNMFIIDSVVKQYLYMPGQAFRAAGG